MNHDNPKAAQIILDSITDGVFTVDREWRITSFNEAAQRITGISLEDAIGRQCCDVFRASICESDCALRETIRSGRPVVNKAVYIIDARGQEVPVSISTAILRDDDGEIAGGVETFRDLSLVEELRRELESRHRFPIIAESDSTVVIHGASGTGKELFARAIHDLSSRRVKRFVAINCGALPESLLE
jgi:PAS domain S-box-containing protein